MDADAPPPRTWTNGSFLRRYWGFLWSGIASGVVASWFLGPFGLATMLVAIAHEWFWGEAFRAEMAFELIGGLFTALVFGLLGIFVYALGSAGAAVVPTLIWPLMIASLTKAKFWGMLVVSVLVGTATEFIVATQIIGGLVFTSGFSWGEYFEFCHGAGGLAGLLVFLWTPEAQDYRRRRKVERANGSPPAAPA